jgi:hypothetical protein
MSQITIRGIDPAVESKIRRLAKQSGKSLNRVILDMVYDYTGVKKHNKKPAANSLRKLAGGWSEQDASEFLESIKSCEQIDEEMWK